MTDVSQGPGWWLASDGRWYPPHLHPGRRGRTSEPTWWRASDGNWYPPELHPMAGRQSETGGAGRREPGGGTPGAVVAAPVPTAVPASNGSGAAARPHLSADASRPVSIGGAPGAGRGNGAEGGPPPPAGAREPSDVTTPSTDDRLERRPRVERDRWVFPSNLADAVGRAATPVRATFTVLALLVGAYVVSVIARGGNTDSTFLDGWAVDGLEVVTSLVCLLRVTVRRPGRAIALVLGLAVLSWSAGDTIVTLRNAMTPPLAADICYLAFYPLAYWAVVLLMRQEVAKVGTPTWLDGAVAGLGAAAVCAAFAFRGLEHSLGGSTLTTAMNLAYPIGDALLLALVVGGTAMLADRKRATWVLVAIACAINAVGDTFNLLHKGVGASAVGQSFNATAWPVAILLLALAAWLQLERRARPSRDVTPGFVLPALAAAAGLVILTVGSVEHIGRIAIGLAAAALVAAGIRMTMSVGTLRSMTIQRHRQSMTDELTGLGNRRYLLHVFDAYMGESVPVEQAMAVLFVDLDGFKEVNDSFGHAAGDHVLRQIGPRLASSLRRTDVLVRLGGDEFAVLLPGADSSHAVVVAQRLAASLQEPFTLELLPITISASIGISVAPTDATDLAELLRCADAAMYRAKLSRAEFQIYDPVIDDDGDMLRLTEELRTAVADGQLVLHFQPQLDLRTGSVSTVEALVRWMHPRLGMISPLKFLPLAEESGLMPALTARVLDDALAQCAAWRAQGMAITVSVNVSPTNLLAQGFPELVEASLARHGLPGKALVLEITETCIVSDYDRCRTVIERLRSCGVVTSIDDFGAGFTSLAHLANLAVAELKLDQAFVADLAAREQERDLELVRSTIGLGHALGLRVVAEGIETEETLGLLARLGCDLAQGFLISRPMPAGSLEFGALYETWRASPITATAAAAGVERPAPAVPSGSAS